MKIEEMIKLKPHLTVTNDERICVIPDGETGWIEYPVTELNENGELVAKKGTVAISVIDYELLCEKKKCWSNGSLIVKVDTADKRKLEKIKLKSDELMLKIEESLQKLNQTDYVTLKLFETMLFDKDNVSAMKEKYNNILLERKIERENISKYRQSLEELKGDLIDG